MCCWSDAPKPSQQRLVVGGPGDDKSKNYPANFQNRPWSARYTAFQGQPTSLFCSLALSLSSVSRVTSRCRSSSRGSQSEQEASICLFSRV